MKRLSGLMLGVLAWLFALPAGAKTASQVFQLNSPRVVVVLTYDAAGKVVELGSGVKLPNGSVATNCHVLKEGTVYRVRYRGVLYAARMNKSDWDRDVCSLDVPGLPAPPVVLGSTRTLQVGAEVYAIGTPEGLQRTLTEGIVSSLRPVGGGSYIQTTAAISPGSSGGGLFDGQGRLLGLTSFYLSGGQQLNFALPVEWIEALSQHVTARAASGTSELQWLNQAAALEDHKDWQSLQALARRWIKARPRTAVGWFVLGEADDNLGQYARAIDVDQQALKINPQEAIAWYELAIAYYDAGQYAQAIAASRQALQINPQDAQAWTNLGAAYGELGHYAQAIAASRQALQINPQSAKAWFGLGAGYVRSGERGKALAVYQRLKTLDPSLAQQLFDNIVPK